MSTASKVCGGGGGNAVGGLKCCQEDVWHWNIVSKMCVCGVIGMLLIMCGRIGMLLCGGWYAVSKVCGGLVCCQ